MTFHNPRMCWWSPLPAPACFFPSTPKHPETLAAATHSHDYDTHILFKSMVSQSTTFITARVDQTSTNNYTKHTFSLCITWLETAAVGMRTIQTKGSNIFFPFSFPWLKVWGHLWNVHKSWSCTGVGWPELLLPENVVIFLLTFCAQNNNRTESVRSHPGLSSSFFSVKWYSPTKGTRTSVVEREAIPVPLHHLTTGLKEES